MLLFTKLPTLTLYQLKSVILLLLVSVSSHAYNNDTNSSNSLSINVLNVNSQPLENMVVYVEPVGHTITHKNVATLEIGQQNKSFMPYISVTQLGNEVAFNNKDNITHHIYSPVGKSKFSIKIRSGQTLVKNNFQQAGEVSMGCNIHDWMSGYMLIVDTPFFAKSDKNGQVEIELNKSGQYKVVVWHPQMNEANNRMSKVINVNDSMSITMQLLNPMDEIPTQKNEDDFDFLSDY